MSNNMSELMIKMINFGINENVHLNQNPQDGSQAEKHNTNVMKYFKCETCATSFITEIALKKHVNTKHPVLVNHPTTAEMCDLKCVLCEDKFDSKKDFNDHIKDHLQEIKSMDPKLLWTGHTHFKCNTCDFTSTNNTYIRNHLLEHVNKSLPTDTEESNVNENDNKYIEKEYSISDDYDENGRPINPDTESESDTDSSD